MNPQLLFVYNADSGLYNTLTDMAHKLLSPDTYACDLCSITHGVFSERDEWRSFIESLPVESAFLHRDEFHRQYPEMNKLSLPALLLQNDEGLVVLLNHGSIAACQTVNELSNRILERLDELGVRGEGH
jgi:hypothetical protein